MFQGCLSPPPPIFNAVFGTYLGLTAYVQSMVISRYHPEVIPKLRAETKSSFYGYAEAKMTRP